MEIYLSPPHLTGEELTLLAQTLQKGWIAPAGDNLTLFEEKIKQYIGKKYALAVNSGTSAMHLAVKALGISKNDFVLCQSLTFVASLNPILYEQAIPVLIDSEPETWNLSPKYLEQAIEYCLKAGKKPKAIVVVHLYGRPAMMKEITEIATFFGIPIIEDAAESLGAGYREKKVGNFGELAFFSFNGNKIITTSAGGMLVSNEEKYISKAQFWATQAKDPAPHYQHSEVGYNYRMSNVLAALGLAQMDVLEQRIAQKRHIFEQYQKALAHIPYIHFPQAIPYIQETHWLTRILFDTPAQAQKALQTLHAHRIEARPLWKPMHLQPLYQNCMYFGESIAQHLFERGLCLPSGTQLTNQQINQICEIITKR
ncbi:MAG: DegT/DnrJ/EryC1/StrS family aminotransferase [Microscillaceae bacterium]|nr:DegT/DnrJ/EryC1/StrS family aminotransferase [Microscillaceae bacterium]MDW8460315.1 DegT/DnrJ/EryC1/StrS family aminotransferase [Cytophagales bacterium]